MRTLALALLAISLPAGAVDRIHVHAGNIDAAGAQATAVDAELRILPAGRGEFTASLGHVTLPSALATYLAAIDRPHISGTWRVQGDAVTLQADGAIPQVAGLPLQFSATVDGADWQLRLQPGAIDLAEVPALLQRWVTLPKDVTPAGQAMLTLTLAQRAGALTADARADLVQGGFQNAAYTWIGEKLALSATLHADLSHQPVLFALQLRGDHGQALAGPVLLDFEHNPLQLQLSGTTDGKLLRIEQLECRQQGLAQTSATATLRLQPFAVAAADIDVTGITFPSAYASYLQLSLATTPFNQLTTAGDATLHLQVRDNLPTALELAVHGLSLGDASRLLDVQGIEAAVYWSDGTAGPPRPSWLSWESARGWNVMGAKSRLDFAASGRNFQLLQPARLPLFDGALVINQLAAENIGAANLSGVFDASIEPISMAPIATALGLPAFQGKLSGRIPGLTYRDQLLSLQGDIEADVFDGHVTASHLSVREPLSAWPRLHADIVARNLDLALITQTFEFGSITGRLDADMTGLETFNWSPVAFDLKLATPPHDGSRHRISQRAVQNLSNIGGGGGGVSAALQSGALRFFQEFGYDRIGLSCRLRNDVCDMAGAGPAGSGFYIVKGSGLPRIDIIGNNSRVDWPLLMRQVADALSNPQGIDVR